VRIGVHVYDDRENCLVQNLVLIIETWFLLLVPSRHIPLNASENTASRMQPFVNRSIDKTINDTVIEPVLWLRTRSSAVVVRRSELLWVHNNFYQCLVHYAWNILLFHLAAASNWPLKPYCMTCRPIIISSLQV